MLILMLSNLRIRIYVESTFEIELIPMMLAFKEEIHAFIQTSTISSLTSLRFEVRCEDESYRSVLSLEVGHLLHHA